MIAQTQTLAFQRALLKIADGLTPTQFTEVHEQAQELLELGIDSSEALADYLAYCPPEKFQVTCWYFGKLGKRRGAKVLLDAFFDATRPREHRIQAAISLSELNSKRAINKLLKESLKSEDPLVREYSAYILGWSNNNSAITQLISLLEDETEHEMIRGQAAEGLGYLSSLPDSDKAEAALRVAQLNKNGHIREEARLALRNYDEMRGFQRVNGKVNNKSN